MSRKIINLEHHLASGCCMWSGIEDLYASKTRQRLPEAFLFALSSFGETALLKTHMNKSEKMEEKNNGI